MDYEKAYKDTLERAKIWQNHLNEIGDKDYADELNYIFPELKESEDERIRNGIISILKHYKDEGEEVCPYPFVKIDDAIAWLEKQGKNDNILTEVKRRLEQYRVEKEKAQSVSERLSLGGRIAALEEILAFEKQGEKSQRMVSAEAKGTWYGMKTPLDKAVEEEVNAWLKKQGEKKLEKIEQKPIECSLDVENYRNYILTNCMDYAEKNGYVKELHNEEIHADAKNWLKSLKERVGG